jgi:hypothetical protein
MRAELGMSEMCEVMQSVVNYEKVINWLSQSGEANYKDSCKEYMDLFIQKSRGGKYLDDQSFSYWKDINIYIVKQSWGSTSCGWGGMGGAAMSSSYTTIIQNRFTGAIFVYYDGKLAYIAKEDDSLKKYRETGWRYLPAYYDTKELSIIYKHNRKSNY